MGQFSSTARVSIALMTLVGSACLAQTTPTNQFITARNFQFSNPNQTTHFPLTAFAVGDLNGDGNLDVVSNVYTGSDTTVLEVLLGDGKGNFTTHAVTGASTIYPEDLKLVDVNGDGKLDLVSTTSGTTDMDGNILSYGAIDIWLGNGDGTFKSPKNILAPKTFLNGIAFAAGDIRGNGKPDIVVPVNKGIQVYWNAGGGDFTAGPTYATAGFPQIQAGADLNGDGKMDVVVSLYSPQGIQVLLSNASGGLTASSVYSVGTISAYVQEIGVGDLNHDGHPDLAIPTTTGIAILMNEGGGTFRAGTPVAYESKTLNSITQLPQGASCGVLISDLRKDGKPDLVSCGSVYSGNGDGTFGDPRVYSVDAEATIAVGDFNSDGLPDLIAFIQGNQFFSVPELTIQFGQPGGNLRSSVIAQTANAESIATADFNRDGIPDVAVVNGAATTRGTATVTVFDGTGQNYFAPGKVYPIGVHGGQVVAGDVNGDGYMDLVIVADAAVSESGGGPGYDTTVLLGKADGTFEPARNYVLVNTPYLDNFHIADTFLVDVNGDGKLDLVGDWGVALGNGNGTFKAPIALPSAVSGLTAMALGDFNKDGHVDLAVLQGGTGADATQDLVIFLGDGSGTFTLADEYDNIGGAYAIKAVDINKDGKLDLVIANEVVVPEKPSVNVISVALGMGNGKFGSLINTTGFTGTNILVADFDRDGKLDLGTDTPVVNGTQNGLIYGRGLGNGSFTPAYQYYVSALYDSYLGSDNPDTYHPTQSVVLDLNGDGYPDIVALDDSGLVRVINHGPQ